MPLAARNPEHDAHARFHRLPILRPCIPLPIGCQRRVLDRGDADDADDGEGVRRCQIEHVVAPRQVLAHHEHGRRVNAAAGGEGVEAVFEREAEAAAVAEGFFLRERAAQPAAARVLGIGHVENQDGGSRRLVAARWGGRGSGEGEREGEGGVEGVGVEDADAGGREAGAVFAV